jgi:hypothetical protein
MLRRKNNYPKSVVESIVSHIGADNGRSTVKGDGDGVA